MIRYAESEDIPRLLDLLLQVDMVHHRARPDLFKGPATKYSEVELEAKIRRRDLQPVFVFTSDDNVVLGYAFCLFRETPYDNLLMPVRTLYIDDLCVDESFRGQGIGRALLLHVKDFARSKGCYNLTLNVWSGNDSAKRFYENCGLKPQKYVLEEIL
ncbi:MAG: GNAT family N-acetyltransferase [Bacteroidales bacterium]|nr:GNAT family N-acetyltransferase [Bacteroidales bacterium]